MRFLGRSRLFIAISLATLTAGAGLAACTTTPEEPTREARSHHARGPANAVIETTLAVADLSDAQRAAVDAIAERLAAHRQDREALRSELREAASDIVRAGSTEGEAFRDAVEQAAAAIEERAALSVAAIEEIHELLTPAQRAVVADGLRDRIDQRFGKHHRRQHRGLEKLAADLMLDQDQVDTLEEIRDDLLGQARQLKPTAAELHELVDAFEGDAFPAALEAFHAEKGAILREKLAGAGGHADRVLDVLDGEQRELLADLIELGPDALDPPRAN